MTSQVDRSGPIRVSYGDLPSQYFETIEARDEAPRGTAVTLHGGWWRDAHDLHLMDPVADHLASRGWTVHNLEYRRTGKDDGRWPATLEDVVTGLHAVPRPIRQPLVLVGHSAGGHLALLAARQLWVNAVVVLAPVTDLVRAHAQRLGESATVPFMKPNCETASLQAASPITHPPSVPQLVVHGRNDNRVPVIQTHDYVAAARAAGACVTYQEVPEGDHFCVLDPTQRCWRSVDKWLGTV